MASRHGTTLHLAEKLNWSRKKVSGHDFSRAAKAAKNMGFSP
jgi:hypothetical protein